MFYLQEALNGNQNNWIYVDKRLSNWNFITYIQCTADRSNLWLFIYFYYSQIMRTFSRQSFYCFLIHIQSYFLMIMMSQHCKIIKVLQNKNNITHMQPFYKQFPTLHPNIFVLYVFNKRNLLEIQDKNILCHF